MFFGFEKNTMWNGDKRSAFCLGLGKEKLLYDLILGFGQ